MNDDYIFYHMSAVKFDAIKTRNMLGNPLDMQYLKGLVYNDTFSVFLDKPTLKDIYLLRANGFLNYGKMRDPIYIYKVDLKKYRKHFKKMILTSIPGEYEFGEKHKNLIEEGEEGFKEYIELKKVWMKKNRIKLNFNSLDELILEKKKYLGFTKWVRKQIKYAKKDKTLYDYYAALIPHAVIETKVPITDISVIETNNY